MRLRWMGLVSLAACEPGLSSEEPQLLGARQAPLGATYTYVDDVQPIFMEHCSPCHEGGTADGCIGAACMAFFYESLTWYSCCTPPFKGFVTEPIQECEGNRVIDCSMNRIHGFAEVGKDPLPPDQVEILEEWIRQGMPKGEAPGIWW